MKTRKLLSILIVLVMVLGLVPAMALTVLADDTAEETTPAGSEPVTIENGDYYLTVNKTQFEVGEPIMVSGSVVSQTDWIGIYNPRNGSSIKWEYVSSVGAGNEFDLREAQHVEDESLTTLPEGEYIIRLMPNNTSTLSLAKALVKIRVGNPPAISGDSTRMSLEKRVFQVGEPINVSAYDDGTTKAWVGIISAGAKQSLKYHYPSVVGEGQYYDVLQGTTLSAGAYIIALVPNNQGYEGSELIAYTTIVIVDDYNYAVENDGTEVPGGDVVDPNPDPEPEPDPEPDEPTVDSTGSVTVSNGTHSMSVNKTKFAYGEEILVTAMGVDSKDWIGIAERGYTDGTIRWYYIANVGNGVAYNIKTAPNINLSQLADIPTGLYTIYLVERDGYLTNGYALNINISVGDVDDPENGATEGGTGEEVENTTIPPTSAEYTPSGNGYAGGTVTVTMPEDTVGGYNIVMYWADQNGKLEGYTAHARFKVSSTTPSYTFSDSVVVPAGASKLYIYAENNTTGLLSEEYLVLDIPSSMADLGTPSTSFFIISDIHIGKSGSAENFKRMLSEAIALKPNGTAIFIVGDMADNGYESQFAEMVSLHKEVMDANGKDASKYPLYLTLGNHDYPAMGETFLKYATLPDGTHPTDTSYDFWLDGYHYIFLGSDSNAGLYANLTEETLSWLDSKLQEDRKVNRPTFVFLHQPMYNTVSGSLPGEGWDGVQNEDALRAVLAKYPEVLFFNGHTHWTMDSVGNIFEGTEELPIRIFNCASVSYLWSGYNTITGENLSGSQGYFVEIYDGKVFVRGRDFMNSQWISSAQYLIEFEGCEHEMVLDSVEYANGFDKAGVASYKCQICGEAALEELLPIITPKGYSVSLYEGENKGFSVGYTVCPSAKSLYEQANGVTLDLGAFVLDPDKATNESFFENGKLTCVNSVIDFNLSKASVLHINLAIKNIGSTQLDTDLIISAYVTVVTSGEVPSYTTTFIQGATQNVASTYTKIDATLYSMSYATLVSNPLCIEN